MTYRPRGRIWRAAALTTGAVGLLDLKAHLRVNHDEEEPLVRDISVAATAAVEQWTQRLLVRREVVLRLPGLPVGLEPVELPGGEVGAVSSVVAEALTVTGATVFGDSPALLVPAATWPVVTADGLPVTITYTAGFVTAPEDLKAAVKMIAADLYDRRGQSDGRPVNIAAINAEWLMARHRIMAI